MDALKYKVGKPRPNSNDLTEFLQQNPSSLKQKTSQIGELQDALKAENKRSVLIIFQAMDAAGKDSTIRNVFNRCDPGGFKVQSFKAPSSEERAHDFMWRCYPHFPADGRMCIFNRSYYEEALVVRVHPNYLKAQGIEKKPTQKFWNKRFKFINQTEKHLQRNGTTVIKFFLDVSQNKQHYRFIRRYSTPEKQWKFSIGDLQESQHWKTYQNAFDDLLEKTSTRKVPWYVIPADDKPMMRLAVAEIVRQHLQQLDPQYPEMPQFSEPGLTLIDQLVSNYTPD